MKSEEITLVPCPQCQSQYEAPIVSLIDVSSDPSLKQAFLSGRLNVSQCPTCGYAGELETPILYHDKAHELALVFTPTQLSIDNSERIIGNLTNRLMNELPAEDRKAYLFTPKSFLTLESLKKAVLAADGITEEMLQAQQAKVELLQKMFQAPDRDALKKLVETHDAELDQQFFEVLSNILFDTLSNGEQQQAQSLLGFRQLVAELSSQGEAIIAEIDKQVGFQQMNPETLLERLQSASNDEEFMALIQAGRQIIDYSFFQYITGQIEAFAKSGNQPAADQLQTLRSRILDVSSKMQETEQKMLNEASQLFSEVTQAKDLNQFVTENIARFNDTFFAVLAANAQEAAKQGKENVAQTLSKLQQQIVSIIQQKIPPEFKFLNLLLTTESPEKMKEMLQQNKELVTPQFMSLLERAKADFESQGQAQMAARLATIKEEAEGSKQGGIILTP